MGIYINKGNEGFLRSRNSEYVDKSRLIEFVNKSLFTEQCFICVSRCRRFGKSMAAKMLAAYYDRSCDSDSLFADLQIAQSQSYEQHRNKYPVIYLDMTSFVTRYRNEDIVREIETALIKDIVKEYADIHVNQTDDFMDVLLQIATQCDERFIFIIDEWDAVFRELPSAPAVHEKYTNWLRRMFKDVSAMSVFACVYMTGILPIKKYSTQSALNNFKEYSMISPGHISDYFGFTREEVLQLASKYDMDYDELEKWYDGYQIGQQTGIFNPNSVMRAIDNRYCDNYWASTGAYEAIVPYMKMNFHGLKDDIINLVSGARVKVNTSKFLNDTSIIKGKDDVLTALIHLGYLSYDINKKVCYVPNNEVLHELSAAIEDTGWDNIINTLLSSEKLLADTIAGNEEAVAKAIDKVHDDNTSILSYNDENSLACVISLAYYYANNDYIVHREYPTGKGFADLVLIPRKNIHSPAIVIELKYDKDVNAAIEQIRRKHYPDTVANYADNIILVGINYDKQTKQHECKIERVSFS